MRRNLSAARSRNQKCARRTNISTAGSLNSSTFSALNSEKRNTEDTKPHGEPRRILSFYFRRLCLFFSSRPSVLSVVFLCVLCVKFRKAHSKMCAPYKYFDG